MDIKPIWFRKVNRYWSNNFWTNLRLPETYSTFTIPLGRCSVGAYLCVPSSGIRNWWRGSSKTGLASPGENMPAIPSLHKSSIAYSMGWEVSFSWQVWELAWVQRVVNRYSFNEINFGWCLKLDWLLPMIINFLLFLSEHPNKCLKITKLKFYN